MRNLRRSALLGVVAMILAVLFSMQSTNAVAGGDPFLGEIIWVAFTFCPKGWAEPVGQLLPIAQNQALFALLGFTYGGDGQTTFALPDLRGRGTIGLGQGPGLPTNYFLGDAGGSESIQLTAGHIPSHTHTATTTVSGTATPRASTQVANSLSPQGNVWAAAEKDKNASYTNSSPNVSMKSGIIQLNATAVTTVAPAGEEGTLDPIDNRQPYLILRPCIALQGIFPSRN